MIAHRIRNARLALGLKQNEAADKAGMTCAALSRIERGRSEARSGTLERIATAYGISLAELVDPVNAKPNGRD